MHKTMIAFADKNKTLPQPFVEKALAKYPSAMGICLIDPADGLLSAQGAADPTLEVVLQTSTALIQPGVLFAFGDHPEGSTDEDIQPFPILTDDKGNTLIYAFITGSYPGSMKQGSSHSDAFHFANDVLKSKFNQLYSEIFDKDMTKLMAFCDKPSMGTDLMSGAVGGSSITIMFFDGVIKSYMKDLTPTEYSFGWTTDDCGYMENVGEFPVKEEKKLPAALAKRAKNLISGAVAAVIPTPKVVVANTEPLKPKQETATILPPQDLKLPAGVAYGKDGRLYWTPPAQLHHKQLKKGYERVVGFLPNNPKGHWQSRPTVPLADAKVADLCRSLPDLKAAMDAKKNATGFKADTPKPVQTSKANGNAQPTTQQSAPAGGVQAPSEKGVPVIDAVAEKALENFIPTAKRFIDPHNNEILDPRTLQAQEVRTTLYKQSLGEKGLNGTVRWPPEVYKLLGQKSLDALVDMALDYRLLWLRTLTQAELDALDPPIAEKKLPAALLRKQQQRKVAM